MSDDFNLESISRNYDVVLVDASAIINPFKFLKGLPRGQKIAFANLEESYLDSLSRLINEDKPFFVTSNILEEIRHVKNPGIYRKNLRKCASPLKENFLPAVTIERLSSKRNRLVSTLINKDHVISFEESDHVDYHSLVEEYDHFKEKYDLSEIDYDFLMSVFALVRNPMNVAVLSNDDGMRKTIDFIKFTFQYSSSRLSFFKSFGLRSFMAQDNYMEELEKAKREYIPLRA